MVDFSNISRLKLDNQSKADFVIAEIEGQPVLTVRPATDANKDLLNYILKNSNRLAKVARQKIDAETLDKTRAQDRETYSKFVVIGWKDVVDTNGDPVDFTPENCEGFLNALPDFIFDRMRQFCTASVNFMNSGDDEPAEPVDLGNS